jgi:hypothetical protein
MTEQDDGVPAVRRHGHDAAVGTDPGRAVHGAGVGGAGAMLRSVATGRSAEVQQPRSGHRSPRGRSARLPPGCGGRAPPASCAVVGAGHQRRGSVSRDCAVRHARQFPHVTMASGVVAEPHSGHSTASSDRVRASVISRDRSSWILSSPRQGHPRWAWAQRPRCVVMEPPPSVPTLLPGIGREGCEAGPVAGQRPRRADPEGRSAGARRDGERAVAEPAAGGRVPGGKTRRARPGSAARRRPSLPCRPRSRGRRGSSATPAPSHGPTRRGRQVEVRVGTSVESSSWSVARGRSQGVQAGVLVQCPDGGGGASRRSAAGALALRWVSEHAAPPPGGGHRLRASA